MPTPYLAGALIYGGSQLLSMFLQNKSQEEANDLNLKLAELTRRDTLEQNKIQNAFTERTIGLQEETTARNRIQNAADRLTEWVNSGDSTRMRRLAPLINKG